MPVKWALNHLGFSAGKPRLPLLEPNQNTRKKLVNEINRGKIIKNNPEITVDVGGGAAKNKDQQIVICGKIIVISGGELANRRLVKVS